VNLLQKKKLSADTANRNYKRRKNQSEKNYHLPEINETDPKIVTKTKNTEKATNKIKLNKYNTEWFTNELAV